MYVSSMRWPLASGFVLLTSCLSSIVRVIKNAKTNHYESKYPYSWRNQNQDIRILYQNDSESENLDPHQWRRFWHLTRILIRWFRFFFKRGFSFNKDPRNKKKSEFRKTVHPNSHSRIWIWMQIPDMESRIQEFMKEEKLARFASSQSQQRWYRTGSFRIFAPEWLCHIYH